MNKIRAILVDDNMNLVNMISEYFERSEVIEVVGKAYDGVEAIDLIAPSLPESAEGLSFTKLPELLSFPESAEKLPFPE